MSAPVIHWERTYPQVVAEAVPASEEEAVAVCQAIPPSKRAVAVVATSVVAVPAVIMVAASPLAVAAVVSQVAALEVMHSVARALQAVLALVAPAETGSPAAHLDSRGKVLRSLITDCL